MAGDGLTIQECCPKLHEFNADVDQDFADPRARAQLYAWLAQYLRQYDAEEEREHERQQRRMKFFLQEALQPGNEHVRDQTQPPPEGRCWASYHTWIDRPPVDYPNGLPEQVLQAVYWVDRPSTDDPNRRNRCEEHCFNSGGRSVTVSAWAPLDLAPAERERRLLVQAPLPPQNLRRSYELYEIAWGLTVLHDCDEYEPFVPEDHECYWWALERDKPKVRMPGPYIERVLASDDWLPRLKPLRKRLIDALAATMASSHANSDYAPSAAQREAQGDQQMLAGDTAPSGFLGGQDLADALRVPKNRRDAFFQMLKRKRLSLPDDCWHEVQNPLPNRPNFLYRGDAPEMLTLVKQYR